MNEEMRIKNVLYNYYAISRFELEKYQDDKSSTEYLLNYYAENLIKGLLNNCFSFILNLDAINMLQELIKLDSSLTMEANNYITVLKDSALLYDSKLLRKEDSVEYLFKALGLYLKHYSNYQKLDDEDILKHRYDIIYAEMIKNESYGSLLIKMSFHIVNNLSSIVLKMRKAFKDNILSDSLIIIKNIYYNALICLLFNDQKALNLREENLIVYFITLLELFNEIRDPVELIRYLNLYVDYYYSFNHHIPLPTKDSKYEVFKDLYGFIEDRDINSLMDKYASNLVNGYHFYDINELFVKFIDKMNACLDIDLEEEITKIHEVVNDMNVLLKNMK